MSIVDAEVTQVRTLSSGTSGATALRRGPAANGIGMANLPGSPDHTRAGEFPSGGLGIRLARRKLNHCSFFPRII